MTEWFHSLLLFALALLVICVTAGGVAVLRGPHLADRAIAIDMVAFAVTCLIGVSALLTGVGALLDVALVLSLISFLGTVAIARFIERTTERVRGD